MSDFESSRRNDYSRENDNSRNDAPATVRNFNVSSRPPSKGPVPRKRIGYYRFTPGIGHVFVTQDFNLSM
jgi:hypothetical protein